MGKLSGSWMIDSTHMRRLNKRFVGWICHPVLATRIVAKPQQIETGSGITGWIAIPFRKRVSGQTSN